MRAHHVDAHTVGLLFGPVFLVFGVVGTLAAGMIISRNDQAMVSRIFRFMRWCIWIALPAAAIGPLTPSLTFKLPLIGLTLLCVSAVNALSSMPFLLVAPQPVRAQAAGIPGPHHRAGGYRTRPHAGRNPQRPAHNGTNRLRWRCLRSAPSPVGGAVLLLNFLVRRADSENIDDAG